MSDDSNVRLLCVVVDDNLKVRDSSFTIMVPSEEVFGGIIGCVVEVTPSLQGVDYGKFRFYKPPLNYPIHVSDLLNGLQLTREHLTDPLLPPYTAKEKFQMNGDNHRFNI
ncbi:hypothetical protein EDB85DRAFT_1885688 [Lactarius pseudohatsudake]|nr:hypothetical protein EDB85DRAFT_1885688 [Lactarius pseudohatsudake]